MKLNKYIYEKLKEGNEDYMGYEATEEDIDEWITDWYNDTFINIRDASKPRGPPMWLAGKNWVERAKDRAAKASAIVIAEENAKNEEV